MSRRSQEHASKRLARAIEDSYPAVLSKFIDTILPHPNYTAEARWHAQRRALEYARANYGEDKP